MKSRKWVIRDLRGELKRTLACRWYRQGRCKENV